MTCKTKDGWREETFSSRAVNPCHCRHCPNSILAIPAVGDQGSGPGWPPTRNAGVPTTRLLHPRPWHGRHPSSHAVLYLALQSVIFVADMEMTLYARWPAMRSEGRRQAIHFAFLIAGHQHSTGRPSDAAGAVDELELEAAGGADKLELKMRPAGQMARARGDAAGHEAYVAGSQGPICNLDFVCRGLYAILQHTLGSFVGSASDALRPST